MPNRRYSLIIDPESQGAKEVMTLQQLVSVIDLTKIRMNKEHRVKYALVRLLLARLMLADIEHKPRDRGTKVRKVEDEKTEEEAEEEANRQALRELKQATEGVNAESVIPNFETVATPGRPEEDEPDGELPSVLLRHKTLIHTKDTGQYGLEGEDHDGRYTASERLQSRLFDGPRVVEDEAVRHVSTSSPVRDYGAEPLYTTSSPLRDDSEIE